VLVSGKDFRTLYGISHCMHGARWGRRVGYEHILINSSDTAEGVRTPDSVMMPEMRSGGCGENRISQGIMRQYG
jgi:hypothetical protein